MRRLYEDKPLGPKGALENKLSFGEKLA